MSTPSERRISVIGLGYVGLPVAVAFAELGTVIALDHSEQRIAELKQGHDRTGECTSTQLDNPNLQLTHDPSDLAKADFHIVAVPTPVDANNTPDLSLLESASRTVGAQLKPGDIVVFESTVYPGATEEVCLPILESTSGLSCNHDFGLGYSPERINPGDKEHQFDSIVKVVSGHDTATLDVIANTYARVVTAGVHRAPTIKVAEAAKVIENTQRDLNIALMNELAVIFNHMQINTADVLAAAGTKWNFLPFKPGLVGGHCIGVDPYYLTYKAQQLGYRPEIILAGRHINDHMPTYIVEQLLTCLAEQGTSAADLKVTMLGITFKEDCGDIRNSKAADVWASLQQQGFNQCTLHDPLALDDEVSHTYQASLTAWEALPDTDVLLIAVAHQYYRELGLDELLKTLKPGGLVMDIKHLLDPTAVKAAGFNYWTL